MERSLLFAVISIFLGGCFEKGDLSASHREPALPTAYRFANCYVALGASLDRSENPDLDPCVDRAVEQCSALLDGTLVLESEWMFAQAYPFTGLTDQLLCKGNGGTPPPPDWGPFTPQDGEHDFTAGYCVVTVWPSYLSAYNSKYCYCVPSPAPNQKTPPKLMTATDCAALRNTLVGEPFYQVSFSASCPSGLRSECPWVDDDGNPAPAPEPGNTTPKGGFCWDGKACRAMANLELSCPDPTHQYLSIADCLKGNSVGGNASVSWPPAQAPVPVEAGP